MTAYEIISIFIGILIYDFCLYQNVLNTDLEIDEFSEVQEMAFDGLRNKIENYY